MQTIGLICLGLAIGMRLLRDHFIDDLNVKALTYENMSKNQEPKLLEAAEIEEPVNNQAGGSAEQVGVV